MRAPVLLTVALLACAEPDRARNLALPESPTAMIATGDVAGPGERAAEFIRNPFAVDPVAREYGRRLYREMNCMYCHGSSGHGGMGPSLIDGEWLFGNTSADRFMSVWGGRARGMPAYGRLLPDESIWKLVAYLEHLGNESQGGEPDRPGGEGPSDTRSAQDPVTGRRP